MVSMVAHRSPKPFVRVRVLLPLPKIDKVRQSLVDFYFLPLTSSLFTKNLVDFEVISKK